MPRRADWSYSILDRRLVRTACGFGATFALTCSTVAMMSGDFSTIPLREAVKAPGLDRHFHDRTTLDEDRTADDRIAPYRP